MNTKKVTMAVLGTIVKVVIIALFLMFIYKAAVGAYHYGYRIFADEPFAQEPGRDVTVSITAGKDAKEIGRILESQGLVEDATVFYLQNLLSSHKGDLQPGTYTLNTSMSAEEMMVIMSGEEDTGDEQDKQEEQDEQE